MSKCAVCGKDICHYRIIEGRDVCHYCSSQVIVHREGFKFKGRPVPTRTDHAKNLGLEKPKSREQQVEYREMSFAAKHDGSVVGPPNYAPVLQRAVRKIHDIHEMRKMRR